MTAHAMLFDEMAEGILKILKLDSSVHEEESRKLVANLQKKYGLARVNDLVPVMQAIQQVVLDTMIYGNDKDTASDNVS